MRPRKPNFCDIKVRMWLSININISFLLHYGSGMQDHVTSAGGLLSGAGCNMILLLYVGAFVGKTVSMRIFPSLANKRQC